MFIIMKRFSSIDVWRASGFPYQSETQVCEAIEKARRYDTMAVEYRYVNIGEPDTWRECI